MVILQRECSTLRVERTETFKPFRSETDRPSEGAWLRRSPSAVATIPRPRRQSRGPGNPAASRPAPEGEHRRTNAPVDCRAQVLSAGPLVGSPSHRHPRKHARRDRRRDHFRPANPGRGSGPSATGAMNWPMTSGRFRCSFTRCGGGRWSRWVWSWDVRFHGRPHENALKRPDQWV